MIGVSSENLQVMATRLVPPKPEPRAPGNVGIGGLCGGVPVSGLQGTVQPWCSRCATMALYVVVFGVPVNIPGLTEP